MGKRENDPLRFSNEKKLRKQMRKRAWTELTIREALAVPGIQGSGKRHRATRHVHPVNGKSVMVDDVTGEIFYLGREDFEYESPQS